MFKSIKILLLGNVFARSLTILVIPLLSRMYSPGDFGLLSIYTSVVSMAVPVLALRYPSAIPLAKSTKMAVNLIFLSFALGFISSIAISPFIAYLLIKFNSIEGVDYINVVIALTLGLCLLAIHEVGLNWITRTKEFHKIAKSTALQSITGNTIKIALGFVGFKPFGLLVGQIVQSGGAAFLMSYGAFRSVRKNKHKISRISIVRAARRYRIFPLLRVPSNILLLMASQAPILLFSQSYGMANTGQLGMALAVTSIPVSLLGQSVSRAYYGEIARLGKNNRKELLTITLKIVGILFCISVLPAVLLFFRGEEILVFVLGESWSGAAQYASVLGPYIVGHLISYPIISVYNVLEKQKFFILMNVVRLLGVLVIFLWLPKYMSFSMYTTVVSYSTFMVVFFLALTLYTIMLLTSRYNRVDA